MRAASGVSGSGLVVPAAVAILACALLVSAGGCSKDEDPDGALLCYVGGTMRPAMEYLAEEYRKQTGRDVRIDYAGSGELLIRIETGRKGDLYVSHDPFVHMLMQKGLGTEWWTVAVVSPTIVVQKGNPKNIHSIRDFARPDVKFGLTHQTKSTTGWIVRRVFEKAGMRAEDDEMAAKGPAAQGKVIQVAKRTRGGGSLANAVSIGDLDAGVVWNAVAFLRQDKLDTVPIDPEYQVHPKVDAVTSPTKRVYDIGRIKVTIAALKCSKRAEDAKAFAEFVHSHRDVFVEKFGFSPAGDESAKGSLHLYCGAGIRHAMEDAVETFRRETGVEVQTDYAGSGTLISTLRLKQEGDLFMPGDVWYLDQLATEGHVASRKMITYFVPVIVVAKGNPKNVKALKDFERPDVKAGLGDPRACQIGRLTEQIFRKNGIDAEAVKQNVLYSMTVNEPGLWVKMGKVDAAIVWDAIAANVAADVETVPIPFEQNIISNVAVGVLTFSRNKPLAERFVEFLAGDEGQAIFAKHHYTVEPPKPAPREPG